MRCCKATYPHLVSVTAVAVPRTSRVCDSALTQVTAQGGCREGGCALLQGPHLFLQSLPLRKSLWPALLQDHGCILLPIACRDKVCLGCVCIPLHTAEKGSCQDTPAPVVSTCPISKCRFCTAGSPVLPAEKTALTAGAAVLLCLAGMRGGGAPCHRWRTPQTRRWRPAPASRGWASHRAALTMQQLAQTPSLRQ